MFNKFVNFDFFFTKLLGIDPCEKRINSLWWACLTTFFMACSRLEAMAIYVVKQACGNDIMACVYIHSQVIVHTARSDPILFHIYKLVRQIYLKF